MSFARHALYLEPRPRRGCSLVYFIRVGDFIKIGTTRDIAQRLSALRCANPYHVELVGLVDGGEGKETRLHGMFLADHHRGEWFRATPRLLEYIRVDGQHRMID